jgi:hypothetical protein
MSGFTFYLITLDENECFKKLSLQSLQSLQLKMDLPLFKLPRVGMDRPKNYLLLIRPIIK